MNPAGRPGAVPGRERFRDDAHDIPAGRPGASGLAESPDDGVAAPPDASALCRSLRRCFATAVGMGLVAAMAAGVATWVLMPRPKFVARATLQAASAPPRILTTSEGDRVEFGTYVRNQLAFIKSRLVLKGLLARPGIAALPIFRGVGDPLEWLEKEVVAESPSGTELLKITLKGEHPGDLARVVNELAGTYLKEVEAREMRERSDRLGKLTENYRRYTDARQDRRHSLKGLAEELGSNDRRSISVKQELDLERLDLARRELLYLQSDLRKAQVELGVLETRARQDPDPAASAWAVAEEVASDPIVDSHARRVVALEGRLAIARQTIRGGGDLVIRRCRQELEAARKDLTDRRAQVMQVANHRKGERSVQDLADRIALGRERVAILGEHERLLGGEVTRLAEEARALNRTSIALEDTRGEADQADEMVKKVAAEIEAQKIEQLAPSRVRMLERAEVPVKWDDRPRLKATGGVTGATFALVLLAFTWRESQAGRIDSTKVVKRQLGLKVLGVLPRLEDRLRRRVTRPSTPRAARRAALYFESIDATRVMILRALQDRPSGILLVTSAMKSEGKTSLACHLAASLARAGKSTLLVDGDLRIPAAHQVLGLPARPGLSEILRDGTDPLAAIRPSALDGLMFLPAGRCDSESLDALSRGDLGGVFATLREQFEMIVVDSSPVLPVADPILIGRHCDALVFSVLENLSTVPAARAAFDRLGSLDLPVLGAVVAGSPMTDYKYRYYRDAPLGPRKGRRPGGRPSPHAATLAAAARPVVS